MKLQNRLKYWRHIKQMNQKEFAEFLGFNQNHYNRWENHRMQPTLEAAWIIAKKLEVKIEDLFDELEGE